MNTGFIEVLTVYVSAVRILKSVMISRNRSSKTIVVDEGVPVDPTEVVAYIADIVRRGSIKRIPSAAIPSETGLIRSLSDPRSHTLKWITLRVRGYVAKAKSHQPGAASVKLEAVWVEADVEVTQPALMAVVALESVVSSAGGSESAWSRTQLSWMAGRPYT